MNDITDESQLLIMPGELTSMDIICGANRVAFNHAGNKRLRFLISFNLDRYRKTKGRRPKGKIIDSIIDQLMYAGTRFVKKSKVLSHSQDADTERVDDKGTFCWEIVCQKEGRKKVAHAFRDMRVSHDHAAALTRLRIRTEIRDDSLEKFKHSHYIAANAMILSAKLVGNESEAVIRTILCDAIDSVGMQTDTNNYRYNQASYPYIESSNKEIVTEVLNPLTEGRLFQQDAHSSALFSEIQKLPIISDQLQMGPILPTLDTFKIYFSY